MKQVLKKTALLAAVLLVIGILSGTMRTNACDQTIIWSKGAPVEKKEPAPEKQRGSLFPDLILGHSLFEI